MGIAIDKNIEESLVKLVDIAKKQNYKISLSLILVCIKNKDIDIQDVLDYFSSQNISVSTEDEDLNSVEDDVTCTPFDPSKIDIKQDKITIDSIIKRIINDELEFDSSFQRKAGLWTLKQKSQLIESIFLKIPLPAFYFDCSDDDKWQIIDGLQRITTIKEYVVNQSFELTGLEFLKELTGIKYPDLPRSLQRRLEETNLVAYFIGSNTPKNVKFNIFKRINTGGLILEPQEIRNALFQGQATKFLEQISHNDNFLIATNYSIKTDRMLDREFCLRYVAFTELDIEKYNGVLDDFLVSGMEYLAKADEETLKNIEEHFSRTMKNCYSLFDIYSFRKVSSDGRRGPVNKALFETWSNVIYNLDDKQVHILIKNKEKLHSLFFDLLEDYSFQNAIKASDKTSLNTRINEIKKITKKILRENQNDN